MKYRTFLPVPRGVTNLFTKYAVMEAPPSVFSELLRGDADALLILKCRRLLSSRAVLVLW